MHGNDVSSFSFPRPLPLLKDLLKIIWRREKTISQHCLRIRLWFLSGSAAFSGFKGLRRMLPRVIVRSYILSGSTSPEE